MAALEVASQLDGAIAREASERRRAITAVEQPAVAPGGLGALALAATLAAAPLTASVQRVSSATAEGTASGSPPAAARRG